MIHGIGTDLVYIPRMEELLLRHGMKFARRILADGEFVEFKQSSRPAEFLAKRFAAKEATAKALGTGFRDGLSLKHIAVGHDSLGRPTLSFDGVGAQLLERFNIEHSHLSLTDERDYALAFVTLT
ncbi:MAG: holo-ACP synthase [Gammaproteobacteria bacterium]|nr:holo-ACP synthase [Gammaproteobacteria bacterium]